MAYVLVIVGLLMIVTGSKGTYAQFGSQVASDFTGPGNFTYFAAAILGIGSLGYVDSLRIFSRLFLTLILLSMIVANRGVFAQFTAALKSGPVTPQGSGAPVANQSSSASGSGSGADGTTLKQSLTKPGGGGFWNYIGIPSPFGG